MIDVGTTVHGKYRIVRALGDGGMGSVYEAHHAVLGTRVAIKVLHPEMMRRSGLVERFLQEARVIAQIRSRHVVQVMDVDRTPEGHAYIVMELLEGEPLSAVLDRQRKLTVAVACDYTLQILSALESAHALGVIHRDLKPENVFVTYAAGAPVLKLIDFGIAKARRTDPRQRNLTVAGVVMGTAEYMAPEQARSADSVDARADVYAVGVMLYEMIAGRRPVRGDGGEDARVIAMRVERGEIVPLVQAAPQAPREIAGLVHHAMAARLEMRFGSAAEMRTALEVVVGRGPDAAPAPPYPSSSYAAAGVAPKGLTQDLPAGPFGPGMAPGPRSEPRVDTVRAPAVATALVTPVYAGPGPSASAAPLGAAAPAPGRPGAWGRTAVLVALALLFGASVVAIVVGTGAWSPDTPAPLAPRAPSVSALVASPAPVSMASEVAVQSPPSGAPAVPALAPVKASARARPAPSGHGASSEAEGGAPAFLAPGVLSNGMPAFPGVRLPEGFPAALPGGFPTALPSALPAVLPGGFPGALPAWPAPSASAGSPPPPAATSPKD